VPRWAHHTIKPNSNSLSLPTRVPGQGHKPEPAREEGRAQAREPGGHGPRLPHSDASAGGCRRGQRQHVRCSGCGCRLLLLYSAGAWLPSRATASASVHRGPGAQPRSGTNVGAQVDHPRHRRHAAPASAAPATTARRSAAPARRSAALLIRARTTNNLNLNLVRNINIFLLLMYPKLSIIKVAFIKQLTATHVIH
jgi:hypothetical protein